MMTCPKDISCVVRFRDKAYSKLNKISAAQKSRQSEDDTTEIAAMLVGNAIRITAYETDVFPAICSIECLVSMVLQRLIQLVIS